MAARPVVYRADWVLPVSSPPFRDGAVLVDGSGTIAAMGHRAVIDPPEGAEVVELGESALLPGLVNVHGHLELTMFRGALEELPFREWILRLVGGKRSVLVDDDYAAAARYATLEAVRAGITSLASTEASGVGLQALVEAGMRGIVYQETFGPDPAQVDDSMRELRERLELLRPRETELVRVGISPHAPYTVSDELFRAAGSLAREEGLPIAIHIAESAIERELVTRGEGDFAPGLRARGIATPVRGRSPVEMLERLGVLEARPLLIHCVDLDDDDVARIADSGSAVAHCPIANAKLGHGLAPLTRLMEAGVRVGMGTDSVASNNRLDLLEEGRVAALLQRAAHRSPALLPAHELLHLCTLGGARALGWEERIGSLEPGKDADLCAISLAGAHVKPVHDPVTALFHSARASDVTLTAVRGRVLYRAAEDRPAWGDEAEERLEDAAARLRGLHLIRPARERAPELMDAPGVDPAELARSLTDLQEVNRWLGGSRAALDALAPLLEPDGDRELRVLDVGTGSADIPLALAAWARDAGRPLRVVATDVHPATVAVARERAVHDPAVTVEIADALRLPYADGEFDVAMCHTALHHFDPQRAVRVLSEMGRVASRGIVVTDLYRSWTGLAAVRLLALTVWRRHPVTRHDGPVSVRAAFTPDELRGLAAEAGLRVTAMRTYFFYNRMTMRAERTDRSRGRG